MSDKKSFSDYVKELDKDVTLIVVLAAILVVLVAALAAALLLPPNIPSPVMPEGIVEVYAGPDGSAAFHWPQLPEGAACRVQVQESGSSRFVKAADGEAEGAVILSWNKYKQPMTLRFSAVAEGRNVLGAGRKLESENFLEITVNLSALTTPRELKSQMRDNGMLELTWTGVEDVGYAVCLTEDGGWDRDQTVVVKTAEDQTALLRFGPDGDLELPEHDQAVMLTVRETEEGGGYRLYGPPCNPIPLARGNLLTGQLALQYEETSERLYTLRWSETKGDYYEVQKWDEETRRWDTVQQVEAGKELVYETGRVPSGADCRYRVAAYEKASAAALPRIAAGPEEVSFRAAFSPLYATVWPIQDQPIRSEARESSAAIATIPGGAALCVLEEKDGYFYVRYRDTYGYVDSRFCMIDLAEYLGGLCAYDIANSYASVFKVHEYPIDQVTGEVIKGFESVRQADGDYLVPLLYPTAQKLIKAAEAAQKDGYRLKIYEAYRPNEATRFLYETTLAQLDTPILDAGGNTQPAAAPAPAENRMARPAARAAAEPESAGTPEPAAPPAEEEPEPVLPPDVTIDGGGEAPAPDPGADTGTATDTGAAPDPGTTGDPGTGGDSATPQEPAAPAQPAPAPAPEPEPEPAPDILTLGRVMTDGRFKISAFLAESVSNHNRGIALDLTLEKISDGQELEMQSAIHDLSWYAATYRNNDSAKLLEKYMKDAGGLVGLTSEWWHFQDDELKAELKLTGYLAKGVSSEGWKKDDTGWRYLKADGTAYKNTTINIGTKQYKVGEDGYVAE